jgi:hypothetical protein
MTDPIALSKIYPTPPSVETTDKRYEETEMMVERHSVDLWDRQSPLDDEMNLVPREFTALPLPPRPKLPPHCIYIKHESRQQKTADSDSSKPGSQQVEPQKFIFPPPSTLTRSKIESLTLPLSSRHHSPHHILSNLNSSPALFTHTSTKSSNQFLNLSGVATASTPLLSPLDAVTPTPISVPPTANRLVPVLPEAHALYVNLALLDSALGTTLSEPLTVNSGDLMQKISKFMNLSNSRRLKLDSVAADPMSGSGQLDGSTGTDLFNFQV